MSEYHSQGEVRDQDTAGSLLRHARERKGLEVKDIAHRLNLQQETIQALEQDDVNKLPASTYVRGYLRSYAKAVDLNPELVVQVYDNDREQTEQPPEIIAEVNKTELMHSKTLPVKAVTYLITFIFALLLLAWLQSHYVVEKNPASDSQNSGAVAPPDSPTSEYADEGHVVHYYPAYEELPDTEPVESQAPDAIGRLSDEIISTIDLPEGRMLSSTPKVQRTAGEPVTVRLSVNEESWIEVYDAYDEQLYMGLAEAGEVIRVEGTGPLNLLLGNTPGVSILYNGKEVEPARYSSSGVSRLILGTDTALE